MYSIMDPVDAKIIAVLGEHGRWSTQKIAKATGIPTTTVYHRIRKLEKSGVIKKYSAVVDYSKLGYGVTAYMLAVVDYTQFRSKNITQQKLVEKLLSMKYVESCSVTTGRFDMILRLRVPRVEDLNQFIVVDLRSIEGVERTETMIVLDDPEQRSILPTIE